MLARIMIEAHGVELEIIYRLKTKIIMLLTRFKE